MAVDAGIAMGRERARAVTVAKAAVALVHDGVRSTSRIVGPFVRERRRWRWTGRRHGS